MCLDSRERVGVGLIAGGIWFDGCTGVQVVGFWGGIEGCGRERRSGLRLWRVVERSPLRLWTVAGRSRLRLWVSEAQRGARHSGWAHGDARGMGRIAKRARDGNGDWPPARRGGSVEGTGDRRSLMTVAVPERVAGIGFPPIGRFGVYRTECERQAGNEIRTISPALE